MIVGLTGYAGSGKDTAAQGLIEIGYERRAFADPLRHCLYVLNPVVMGVWTGDSDAPVQNLRLRTIVDEVGWDKVKQLSEVRRLLQVFGTEVVRRHFGEYAWINILSDSLDPGVDYVITDVRFPNEVEMVQRRGGIVIRIVRPGVGPVNEHISDATADLRVDSLLLNDGTPAELWAKIKDVVK